MEFTIGMTLRKINDASLEQPCLEPGICTDMADQGEPNYPHPPIRPLQAHLCHFSVRTGLYIKCKRALVPYIELTYKLNKVTNRRTHRNRTDNSIKHTSRVVVQSSPRPIPSPIPPILTLLGRCIRQP